ncbi:MAG: hypothetical protein IPH45_20840 [Bacteroidales bacterium]|nr:hypothetical protein [Bacteroidales bacterium]
MAHSTEMDWTNLKSNYGSYTTCGGFMKEKGTTHWAEPNYLGSNTYGFTALPSGFRHYSEGDFISLGTSAEWWTRIHAKLCLFLLCWLKWSRSL